MNHTIIGIFRPFVRLSVPHLLRHLRIDRNQTWQECRGWVNLEPKGIRYHGNQCAAMVTNKRWFLEARSAIKLMAGRLGTGTKRTSSYCLPWQPICCHGNKKSDLLGQIRIFVGHHMAYDVMDDVTLPMPRCKGLEMLCLCQYDQVSQVGTPLAVRQYKELV